MQGAQQFAKFHQRAGGDQWGADDEGGTSGAEHPRWQSAGSATFQLDDDVFAVWKFLALPNRQTLSVQRVPTIVDRD
jgi:hypothetical protein